MQEGENERKWMRGQHIRARRSVIRFPQLPKPGPMVCTRALALGVGTRRDGWKIMHLGGRTGTVHGSILKISPKYSQV